MTMQHINTNQLNKMASRFRAHLVNSLSGFKSTNLIGTIDNDGHTNLAIFSSVVHLGASPALVGFVMRPNTVERHTLNNIKQTKEYTINQVSKDFWQAAHQTSAKYSKKQCEFESTGLTPVFQAPIKPPFVKESKLKYAVTLKEIIPISLNQTAFIIGEITDIICQPNSITDDGYIDLDSLGTVANSGLDSYHNTQPLGRLKYAKPNQPIELKENST